MNAIYIDIAGKIVNAVLKRELIVAVALHYPRCLTRNGL